MKHGNSYDGTLIAWEGIDNSGKTTLIEEVDYQMWDSISSPTHTVTKEPYSFSTRNCCGTEDSEAIFPPYSMSIHDERDALSHFFSFCGDRVVHTEELLEPSLRADKVVLTDRYVGSTYAYQSIPLSFQLNKSLRDTYEWMETVMDPWLIPPDYTIFVDVPISTAMDRLGEDRETFENTETLIAAQDQYRDMYANDDSVLHIDGTAPIENNAERIRSFIERVA